MRTRLALSCLLLTLAATGCRDVALRGTVVLPEFLPPATAKLEVTLADASGATPRVLATQRQDVTGRSPWPWALTVRGASGVERGVLRARLFRSGQAMYESAPVAGPADAAHAAAIDTLRLRPVRGAAPAPDPRMAAVRAKRDALVHASGDAPLGTTASHWQAWSEAGDVRLVEEVMEPAEGGQSTLAYLFDHGTLLVFEERGERAALLPGRPATLARIDVDIRWPAAAAEPDVWHRIEGLDAMPDASLIAQVLARAERVREMAMGKAGK